MKSSLHRPILLVEDNAMDIDLTKRAFARQKPLRHILVACNGEEVQQYMQRWEAGEPAPSLILLDIKIPKISGLEVLSNLKNHPEYRYIPVVMLTSSTEDSDVSKAYHLGANSYILKPVDFDKLIELIKQLSIYWCELNTLPG